MYQLVWKWTKKRHPRKQNTWIYEKYWIKKKSIWVFSTTNIKNGLTYYLKTHKQEKNKKKLIPVCLGNFDQSTKKIKKKIILKKRQIEITNLYKIILKKQLGLCLNCKQPLYKFKENRFLKYINIKLLHKHCNRIN